MCNAFTSTQKRRALSYLELVRVLIICIYLYSKRDITRGGGRLKAIFLIAIFSCAKNYFGGFECVCAWWCLMAPFVKIARTARLPTLPMLRPTGSSPHSLRGHVLKQMKFSISTIFVTSLKQQSVSHQPYIRSKHPRVSVGGTIKVWKHLL